MTAPRLESMRRAKSLLEERVRFAQNEGLRQIYQSAIEEIEERRGAETWSLEKALGRSPLPLRQRPFSNRIASAFRDAAFAIRKAPADGDCLFHVVSMATGHSVSYLKQLVAQGATGEEFATKKALLESALREHPRIESQLRQTPPSSPYFRGLQQQCANYADDIRTYGWIAQCQTLGDFRRGLATQGTWGDADAVGHMEKALGLKLLILNIRKAPTPEVYCNTMIARDFAPSHYVLVDYRETEAHYNLVEHAGHSLFRFEELPYAVRRLFERECPQIRDVQGWCA